MEDAPAATTASRIKVLITGAGFSGICMGIKLKNAAIDDFLILEKAKEVGGTWRENTYPGAECDIPSALYSYSFEHNPQWQYKWSGQEQILDYQKHVVDKHRQGAYAYLGMTTHGFPKLFMLYGPNTNLGHSSIILMIEAQTDYIVRCITRMDSEAWASIEVRDAPEQDFNNKLQARLGRMAFSAVEASWYMDAGRITNNWAGSTLEYTLRLRKVNWQCFDKVTI